MLADREMLKRSRQLRRRRHSAKFFLSLFLVLAVLGGVWWLLHTAYLNITTITVFGNRAVSGEELQASINDSLAGSKWFVFPHRNTLFLPKTEIKDNLLQKFNRLASVVVSRNGLNGVKVQVIEREPKFVWCNDSCYLADETGFLFATAPDFSRPLYFAFYGPAALNHVALDSPSWQRLLEFQTGLIELLHSSILKSFHLVEARALTAGDYRFEMNNVTGDNQVGILVNLNEAPTAALANFRSALAAKSFAAELSNHHFQIAYFDLRFPAKVFYKFKA